MGGRVGLILGDFGLYSWNMPFRGCGSLAHSKSVCQKYRPGASALLQPWMSALQGVLHSSKLTKNTQNTLILIYFLQNAYCTVIFTYQRVILFNKKKNKLLYSKGKVITGTCNTQTHVCIVHLITFSLLYNCLLFIYAFFF